jgi:hypothetical protein
MQPKLLIAVPVLIASALSALIAGVIAFSVARRIGNSHITAGSIRMRELNIVDENGRICMTLSASDQVPTVELLDSSGQKRITMIVDKRGYGSVRLSNPDSSGPVASLEIDDKGAHVKFDRTGGASSYLFLNNSAGSGVVLLDSKGSRKLDLMVSPSGETEFRRYDQSSSTTP